MQDPEIEQSMKQSAFNGLSCLLLALSLGCSGPEIANEGELGPGFKLESLDGTWISSNSFKGEALVLNWCGTTSSTAVREAPRSRRSWGAEVVRSIVCRFARAGLGGGRILCLYRFWTAPCQAAVYVRECGLCRPFAQRS